MRTTLLLTAALLALTSAIARGASTPPKIGDLAPNFTLRTLAAEPVELATLTARGEVVLVVLRGWPGYQCPLCTKQVGDFLGRAADFTSRGAQVVMVYPGPADKLQARATAFVKDKPWPEPFTLVLDPDYTFTNAYGLRWEAKNETAYPSTFVIGRDGRVRFAQVSKSHGGRVSVDRALAELKK